MDEHKHYKKIESEPETANEPMAVYNPTVRSAEEYLESISGEVMRALVDLSVEDYKMGRCTPHSQIDAWVKERMGWK